MKTKKGTHISFKFVVIGDGGVGKTTLLHRYVKGLFLDTTKMTIGVEFLTKQIELEDYRIKLMLWDISGQERFFFMIDKYLKGATGALLLFDITDMNSFEGLEKWINIVRAKNPNNEELPIVLIAAKCDLEKEFAVVSNKDVKEFQKNFNVLNYVKTSSKSGLNVDNAFECLTRQVLINKNLA